MIRAILSAGMLLGLLAGCATAQNAPKDTLQNAPAETAQGVPGATLHPARAISSAAALQEALAATPGGGRIVLAGGVYGVLALRGRSAPDSAPLVLRSADPANPARFSGLELRDMRNVILENVVFDYSFRPGDMLHLRPFQVLNSRGVTIRGALFDGDLARGRSAVDDGFATGFGLGVTGSTGVTLENSEIRGFYRGLVVHDSRQVLVRGNDLHGLRMDGMNFAQVRDLRIEANHIHDFARALDSGDHADMIQFWTNGTTAPSRDIVIRGNLLNSGQGWYTQSIFMRNDLVDRGLAGPAMFYRNVLIEGNMILNAHLHGITVGETDGLVIRNNTVVRNARSEGAAENPALWTPQIRVAEGSRDVAIQRNVTAKLSGPGSQPDWQVADNLFVQDRDRMGPGFYGTVFGPEALSRPDRPASFAPHPGGPLDGSGIGAAALPGNL
ncbi:right-handed parallel beta-helix repeat-containing protein [Puniceibacterium confluentis]|uniref:right-handed parallel beta-helix repeat-containing protein n=1 Tax=Puniceibacterium confluentis TaxID=1958944 RepID=UPI0011B45DBB|nr:right-handed parallel beta-helix repeat-containing protein [Puniceibacterium confluentis]